MIYVVDTYFEVRNDNGNVVIDDNYQNLSFVHFSEIITVQASEERNYQGPDGTWYSWTQRSDGAYGRYESYSRVYTLEELDLTAAPSYMGIRRVDSIGGGFTIPAVIRVYSPTDSTQLIGFRYRIYSMEAGAQYQLVSFAPLSARIPSREGLAIYNSNGQLVFDAALGYMQVMDSQYRIRDLYSGATESFPVHNSGLPDLDFSRMFLITRLHPYATTGGTIIINHRQYVPRLRKDAEGRVYVDLGMWGKTGGSRLQQYQRVFNFMVAYVHF